METMRNNLTAVICPLFCFPDHVYLIIARKHLAIIHDKYKVTDDKGRCILNVERKLLSIHSRHVIRGSESNSIATLKRKRPCAHNEWHVFKGDGSESAALLFTTKCYSNTPYETEVDVYIAGNKEHRCWDFKVVGSWLERSFVVYNTYFKPIARIQKKQGARNAEDGKETFQLTVYPQVDYAFITALAVIVREDWED